MDYYERFLIDWRSKNYCKDCKYEDCNKLPYKCKIIDLIIKQIIDEQTFTFEYLKENSNVKE